MALVGIGARVINAGVMFGTQIMFARILGTDDYGVLATASTFMLLVAGFSTLGLTAMPQRFLPEYESRTDHGAIKGLVSFSNWAPFMIGSIFATVGALIAWLARDLLSPTVALVTCLAMLTVPAQASLDVVEGIALTRGWKMLAYGLGFILRPLLVPVIFIIAWLAGVKPDATLAVVALVGATWLAALALIWLSSRRLTHDPVPTPARYDTRRWLLAGLPVMLIDGAFMLMTSTDIILLTLLRSDAEVGIYSAAARLVALVAFVHHGLTWASGHHFSALHQAGDRSALAAYARRMTLWTFLPSAAVAMGVSLASPLLLLMFGKDFSGGSSITIILLLGLLIRASVGPAEQLLVMTDNQAACAKAYGLAFAANVALGLWLVPVYGGAGAAASTALAYGLASVLVAREVNKRLGFDVHIFALWQRKTGSTAHV
jgi:O-antigen/teichoic acid export membrane protein